MATKLMRRLSAFTTALIAAHKHGDQLRQPTERLVKELYLDELRQLGAAVRRLLNLPSMRELPALDDEEE
jgi:hypothetical protein